MAGKKAIVTTDPYTDVALWNLSADGGTDGQALKDRAVMVKDDEGNWNRAKLVSEEYQLVHNGLVRDVVDDVCTRSGDQFGYAWEEMKTIWNGKSSARFMKSVDPVVEISNGHKHPLHIGFMARNSYDLTSSFSLEFFAVNGYCTNEFHARNLFGFYTMRHINGNGGWDVTDACMNVGESAQRLIEVAPRIKQLSEQPMTIDVLTEAKKNVNIPDSYWGKVIDRLAGEDNNKFGLFQALTAVTTHDMKGFGALRSGDSVGEYFLNFSGN